MGLFRKDGELPESVEDETPQVWAEPKEAVEEDPIEEEEKDLFVNRLLGKALEKD